MKPGHGNGVTATSSDETDIPENSRGNAGKIDIAHGSRQVIALAMSLCSFMDLIVYEDEEPSPSIVLVISKAKTWVSLSGGGDRLFHACS